VHLNDHMDVYDVSSHGRVRSKRTLKTGVYKTLMLSPWKNGHGYMHVTLNSSGKRCKYKVHRLVAFAFLGGPEKKTMVVDHIDRDKSNNRLSNLRWATYAENNTNRIAPQDQLCQYCGKPWKKRS